MKYLGLLGTFFCGGLMACAAGLEGQLDFPMLTTGSGRVLLLSRQGEVVWEHKAANIHDAWRLPNGNVLFADGNITEVTPAHEVVFQYKPELQKGGGAYTCQRLTNGNTLVGENASGRVVEVDGAGKVVFSLQLQPMTPGSHANLRMVRKLKNGNYLVCEAANKRVCEYHPDGAIVWEKACQSLVFAAVRLENGNTMISSLGEITEYDAAGQQVWQFKASDLPDLHIRNMTGFQVLPKGSLVIGCYAAYDKEGLGTGMFEISRERKLVWRYVSPNLRDKAMMGVQKLDPSCEPPLR